MKKALFVLFALFIFASFSFSASVPLVKYYSNNLDSHSCLPSSPLCAYTISAIVNDSDLVSCSDATAYKVLGLSDATNAHAEKNGSNVYSNNICMKSSLFSGATPLCSFTAAGAACSAGSTCLFGLSGATNAHLSSCNVFGSSEIKLCCSSSIVPPQAQDGACGSATSTTYPAGTANISSNLCSSGDSNESSPQFNSQNTATWFCKGINGGANGPTCTANRLGSGPIPNTPTGDSCIISSFEFVEASQENGFSFTYSCSVDSSVDFTVFDSKGAIVYPLSGNSAETLLGADACSSSKKTHLVSGWPTSTTPEGVYSARLMVNNTCMKDIYFSVSTGNANASIPDGGLIGAILVSAVVLVSVIYRKRTI